MLDRDNSHNIDNNSNNTTDDNNNNNIIVNVINNNDKCIYNIMNIYVLYRYVYQNLLDDCMQTSGVRAKIAPLSSEIFEQESCIYNI